jgi:hypothetical protein
VLESVNELREIVDDPEKRVRLTEIFSITSLLSNCIIDSNYRLADDWIGPLRLSPLGERTVEACMKCYRRLKPNDAKMAVFLTFGCTEGLLIDIATDIDGMRQQISKEMRHGRIRFPYIFGRELHDAAAELFPAQEKLDNAQTIRLLNQLPAGVFQEGRTVVGPYGCTHSDIPRLAGPHFAVPGYRCPDEACTSIHRLRLKTADGSISRARTKIRQYIERNYSKAADEHAPLIRRALMLDLLPVSVFPTVNLIDVLSDGLSVDELRAVIDHLMRRTFRGEGRKNDIAKRLGAVITNPSDFAAALGRPELIQIALLHSDADLIGAIDEVVHQEKIVLRNSELRVSRVRRWDSEAEYPRAEIGVQGARFTAPASSGLIVGRMLHILHSLYYKSEFWDAGDLAYAIEEPNGLSSGELLNLAVRNNTTDKLFRELILPYRRAVEIAARELYLFDYDSLPRDEVLERLRWKVGEPVTAGFPDLRRIDKHLAQVQAANDSDQGHDLIRAAASNLFAAVEDALNRSLTFCIWAFSTDHYVSQDGFTYDPELDRSIVSFIETSAPASEPELKLKPEKNTLVPLGAGFPRLAKALRNLDETAHVRPEESIPPECEATSRPFAFPFTRMFFNLDRSAQADVLNSLQTVGRHAQNADVIEARNWTSHGDRPFPGTDRIRLALKHITELRNELQQSGLYPRLYELVELSRDGVGREELIYESDGVRLSLFRPLWAVAPKLPTGQASLVLAPIANTHSSGPLRFRIKPNPGTDPYWEGWPKRWPTGRVYSEKQPLMGDTSDLAEAG